MIIEEIPCENCVLLPICTNKAHRLFNESNYLNPIALSVDTDCDKLLQYVHGIDYDKKRSLLINLFKIQTVKYVNS